MAVVLKVMREHLPPSGRSRRPSTGITITSRWNVTSLTPSGSRARAPCGPVLAISALFPVRWAPNPTACAAKVTKTDSFQSCAHGAGRRMSRGEAKRRFSLLAHAAATSGIECRKHAGVIDETPMAYKDIDAVMAAQTDLVEVVHTLRQVVCVKG